MKSLRKRLFLAVASGLLPTTIAQICTPEPAYGDIYTYYVDNQSTLDTLASECTSINGSIIISRNYTGSFYLPNIRNIGGDIQRHPPDLYSQDLDSALHDATPSVDSISVPDLEHLGGRLDLKYLSELRNISAPKLSTIGMSVSIAYAYDVNLRSLRNTKYAYIFGNLSSLRLDSLEEVSYYLEICNMDACNSTLSSPSSLELFLLSLTTVGHISLKGRISSLAVPDLTSLGQRPSPAQPITGGFQLTTDGGPPLNLSFPHLDTIDGKMELKGNIGSLSMPKMIDTNMELSVEASDPLAIDLPLHEIGKLTLRGNISSVNLPNLRRAADGISIYTDLALDCDKVRSEIFTNVSISNGWRTCSVESSSNENPKSDGLSTSAKVGISIGCGLAGIFLVSLIPIYLLHRHKKKKQLKTVSEVELTPPTYQTDQQDWTSPPEYSPGENGHGASPRET